MSQFLPYCKICFGPRGSTEICVWCDEELQRCRRELPISWMPLSPQGGYRRTALFNYENCLRRLLLRIKVHGDLVALAFLIDLFIKCSEVMDLVEWSEVVVAAPSSLWGRLRGRIDMAAALALAASRLYGRPLIGAPWQLFWRTRKRAQIAASLRQRRPALGRLHNALSHSWHRRWSGRIKGRRVLLIDDISTSGTTLLETAVALEVAQPDEIRLLVLAAPRP